MEYLGTNYKLVDDSQVYSSRRDFIYVEILPRVIVESTFYTFTLTVQISEEKDSSF